MNTRQNIDVEFHFNKFVKDFGGQLISELISKNPTFKNADYLFEEYKVVVELKCLKKNLFEDKAYIYKIAQLTSKWCSKGWTSGSDIIQWSFGRKALPKKCNIEIIKLAKPLLESIIRKANKQLVETIENLNLLDYEGLILIVNDGNYAIQNQHFFYLISEVLNLPKFKDSKVDGFVYTTVNMPTLNSENTVDADIWAPSYKGDNKDALRDFVNKFGYEWLNYYNKNIEKIDMPINQTEDYKAISDMKFLPKDFPRKNIIWEKKE